MKKVGLSIEYSYICSDYNTSYLDRDNNDPATKKCMKQVLTWSKEFLTELLGHFDYKLHNLSSSVSVKIDDVAAKRFLFYSLEKEITLQTYVIQKEYKEYGSLGVWDEEAEQSILIQNDEDGGEICVYFTQNSPEHLWLKEKLKDFSSDEIVLEIA